MTADELAAKSKALVDGGKHQPPSPAIERKGHVHEDVPLPSESPPDEEPGDLTVVDGAELLDELLATITRYVAFPDEHAAAATALWIATTHALPAFQHAPRLAITSPQKRCGKSRTLDVISGTCHRPLVSVNATVAAIFRSIGDKHPPTLIIDEADTLFGTKRAAEQNEDLRALLNAGHQRGRPALRCVGPNQIPTEFSTFAMAALAGIGAVPDTITDRAINITMRRRTSAERVSQFRTRRDGPILENLRTKLATWAADRIDELSAAEPGMPVEDRAADTWEPLIAVADAAGGHWPQTARVACKALVDQATDSDEEQSLATKLLADIRDVFSTRNGVAFLASTELVAELRHIEDSPWDDYDLNARKLAHRLRQFGIKPGRAERNTVRGYALETFADAFARYTRPHPSNPSATGDEQARYAGGSETVDASIRPHENIRLQETAGQASLWTGWTDEDAPPAENGSTATGFTTPAGPGRCRECGYHVATQGHRDTCPANEGIHRNTRLPRLDADRSDTPGRVGGQPAQARLDRRRRRRAARA